MASADTGSVNLPVTVLLCETTPATGQCLAPPSPTVTTQIDPNETNTFGVFVTASGPVPYAPAASRIQILFEDAGGVTRGATSVAVRMQ